MDAAAKALNRFEVYTKYRDFKAFHHEQAVEFKKHLAEQRKLRSGETLSQGTLYATLTQRNGFSNGLSVDSGKPCASRRRSSRPGVRASDMKRF